MSLKRRFVPVFREGRRRGAHHVVFPLALAHGCAVLPLWLYARQQGVGTAAWHGHEMLFGYTLLVVAGFLATRLTAAQLGGLVLSWSVARLAVFLPASPLTAMMGLGFPIYTVWLAARPLWRGAKRHENRIVPMVLLLLLMLDGLWWLGAVWGWPRLQYQGLIGAVDLYSLLMLIVGGRVLPASVGGFLERQGIARRDRIRRGYELPLAGLMAAMLLADMTAHAHLAGLLAGMVAAVTLVRVAGWQLHRVFGQTGLVTLAVAYLWLIPGLLLKSAAQLLDSLPPLHGIHGLTVGALGSLTLVMMTRTSLLQRHLPLQPFTDIAFAVAALSLAAVARLLAMPGMPWQTTALWVAAMCWSLALAVGLARQWRLRCTPTEKSGADS